jgi:hypothetical protein
VNFDVLSSYRSIEILGYSACEEEHSLNNYVTLNENDGEICRETRDVGIGSVEFVGVWMGRGVWVEAGASRWSLKKGDRQVTCVNQYFLNLR